MRRREFLFTVPAAPIAAAIGWLPAGAFAATPTASYAPPDLVIVDRRSQASADASASARRIGAKLHSINGDPTSVWYEHLSQLWPRGRATVVEGLTTPEALLCLEQLGGDNRMRVVSRQRQTDGLVNWRLERA